MVSLKFTPYGQARDAALAVEENVSDRVARESRVYKQRKDISELKFPRAC